MKLHTIQITVEIKDQDWQNVKSTELEIHAVDLVKAHKILNFFVGQFLKLDTEKL